MVEQDVTAPAAMAPLTSAELKTGQSHDHPFISRTFLAPRCSCRTLDTYWARRSVLRHLQAVLPRFSGTLLDIGCGQMPYRPVVLAAPSQVNRYIGLDFDGATLLSADQRPLYRNVPDLTWDGQQIPLPENSVDCAMATEVLEHCADPENVLREIRRVMKPGGVFFFTVPFLWPLHDLPHDEYRYTPFALRRHLQNAGLVDISLTPTGGWNASLAQMIGLWARRRPMARIYRPIVCAFALPLIRILTTFDALPSLGEGTPMITGLAGTATKPSALPSRSG